MKSFHENFTKYTQAGPNYQYYPTTLSFRDSISQESILEKLENLNGKKLNLQLFFPFCHDPDCHTTTYQIQVDDDSQLNQYLEHIEKEVLIYKKSVHNTKIVHIHLSGNEVSLLGIAKLSWLLELIADAFNTNIRELDISLDINARMLDVNKLKALKQIGINRLKISTLNFDYQLEVALGKYQSYQSVEKLIQEAKRLNFDSMKVELMYGLPCESYESMGDTVNRLIALRCEHICLTHYFHRPYLFKLQKKLNQQQLPSDDEIYATFKFCVDTLLSAGYNHLGMNCFVNKDSELYSASGKKTCSYNHSGYTLNAVNDVVALGVSSISKVDALFYQNFIGVDEYYQSLDDGTIPVFRGCLLSADHFFRKKIIKSLIMNNRFDMNNTDRLQLDLLAYIKETCSHLYEMEEDGLVILSEKSIQVTELGRYFLKNICALFDLNMRDLISYTLNKK